ncbi:MAG TPA: DNA repair protein RecN [Victivallales bacterium]|nr:DNA repair protein RecN [Victivallales bacterium]
MIERLRISKFALIDKLEMELSSGFNVITGETGAGKTIIMQAVELLLGGRATKDILREGSENCEISAEINISRKLRQNLQFLNELGIDISDDGPLLLRRIIGISSSKNYINDSPVSLNTLKTLGEILIDTHGSHEHQSILKQSVQLNLLDRYGKLDSDTTKCSELYKKWRDAIRYKEDFERNLPDAKEEDYLKHIFEEINSANPLEGEDEELSSKHKVISNSQGILETTRTVLKLVSDSEESILEKIFEVNRNLLGLEKIDPEKSAELMTQTEEIRSKISSLSDSLGEYQDSIEMDEKEFIRLEERLRILTTLKRKYGPEIRDVLKSAREAGEKLEKIRKSSELRTQISEKISSAKSELDACADTLSKKRKTASAKFAKEVEAELKKLGFIKSSFGVEFSENEIPGSDGKDKVEFVFSANPGEAQKALRNVASSGEISRVMLALKTVLASADSVPILIFDEIDSNIGGTTASVVGKELAKLANTHQLICISHLPQVASEADRNFVVEKKTQSGRTFTEIRKLEGNEKIAEIARMLGGTEAALKHAKEMTKGKK